jgi:hypothetical protein
MDPRASAKPMDGTSTKTGTGTKLSTATKVAIAVGLLAAAGALAYLILPGELAKHAVSEGTKTTTPPKPTTVH